MVYIDSKGFRVETAPDSPDGVVTFYPQGGGFQRVLPTIVFDSLYKPELAEPGFKAARFSGDWMEGETFPGYTDGNRWNGWAMPLFDFETAQRIVEGTNDPGLRYDSELDAFVYLNPDFPDEPEIFGASFIKVDGQPVKTYGVGAGSWCWYEK
jgi:hypothetical protein